MIVKWAFLSLQGFKVDLDDSISNLLDLTSLSLLLYDVELHSVLILKASCLVLCADDYFRRASRPSVFSGHCEIPSFSCYFSEHSVGNSC